MTKAYLDEIYGVTGDRDVKRFYDAWADSYDAELKANGYETPTRCAAALRECGTSLDTRILDVGCGTGLSGVAFVAQGYTDLHGTDLSPDMLAAAEARQIYGKLWVTDPDAPLPVLPGDYDVIAAVGVISPGAAPASMLTTLADLLLPGGRLLFSFNDHALADPSYMEALASVEADGGLKRIFEEHGPHLPARDIRSTVYLLERS
jgi:predicted TPR repeat methyltransferase